jgi:hypothetical protein
LGVYRFIKLKIALRYCLWVTKLFKIIKIKCFRFA